MRFRYPPETRSDCIARNYVNAFIAYERNNNDVISSHVFFFCFDNSGESAIRDLRIDIIFVIYIYILYYIRFRQRSAGPVSRIEFSKCVLQTVVDEKNSFF